MEKSKELLNRVEKALNARGYQTEEFNGGWGVKTIDSNAKAGTRIISAEQVYRSNATTENVTVKLEVQEYSKDFNFEQGYGWLHRIFTVKVPKNASDKVIENRINKCIEAM